MAQLLEKVYLQVLQNQLANVGIRTNNKQACQINCLVCVGIDEMHDDRASNRVIHPNTMYTLQIRKEKSHEGLV